MKQMKEILRKVSRVVFPKRRVLKISKLRKEASVRDYYRIHLSSDKTCIAMVFNNIEQTDSDIVNKIFDSTEVFENLKINVPHIYKYFPEDKIILLKDAGSVSLESYCIKNGVKHIVSIYKQMLDSLFKIYHTDLSKTFSQKTPFATTFTEQKFFDELVFFLNNANPQNLTETDKSSLKKAFQSISKALCSEKYILTHRDLHSRNIFISDDSFVLIDHQDARLGPYLYDFVSLIKDSYVNLSHQIETELIAYYISKLKTNSPHFTNHDEFFSSYYLCLLQRSLKAAGTFYFQTLKRNNMKFKKYIPTVLNYANTALEKVNLDDNSKDSISRLIQTLMKEY
ncbi:MAG: hypothetical protein ACD_79C01398G0002 [uncultured bacterium]|nr:MAG: hypothetical protein ACD_79C01398G0002 [uncultured bacterium]